MKWHDYHIHAQAFRGQEHAERFVQRAIALGFSEICITDHMPLSISDASDRIPQGGVKKYCEQVRRLAEAYEDQITVKTGIEVDYHPDFQKEIEAVLKEGDFDYVIGSSHLHIPGYGVDFAALSGDEFADKTLDNILLSVKSGYFDTVAHMDLYLWVFAHPERFPLRNSAFDYELHREKIEEILEEIARRRMFLEINTHRMAASGKLKEVYPCRETLKLSLKKNICYRFGSDAHVPEHVGFGRAELEKHPLYRQCLEKEND